MQESDTFLEDLLLELVDKLGIAKHDIVIGQDGAHAGRYQVRAVLVDFKEGQRPHHPLTLGLDIKFINADVLGSESSKKEAALATMDAIIPHGLRDGGNGPEQVVETPALPRLYVLSPLGLPYKVEPDERKVRP